MSGKVWFSGFMSNSLIGHKQGLRAKFRGEDWELPQHRIVDTSDKVYEAMKRHTQGYVLQDEDLPEAVSVFDEKSFKRVGELFIAGRFYAVRRRLACILEDFNLGEGGLIPFKSYRGDLKTPVNEEFFYINFGARKKTFLPAESKNVELITSNPSTRTETWDIKSAVVDGDIAVSTKALSGADLWAEENVKASVFMSDPLTIALQEAKLKLDLRFAECRIVENAQ